MKILTLEPQQLIGEGKQRRCYKHPTDDSLCVKVLKNSTSRYVDREIAYFKRLEKRQIKWDCLSRYYGKANTNMGVGDVYELIKDDDHQTSKTLQYYLENGMPEGAIEALKKMDHYLLDQRVITTGLLPRNIALQKRAGRIERAVVVDDVGNADFIPLTNVSPYLARLKINRRLTRFKKLLLSYGVAYD